MKNLKCILAMPLLMLGACSQQESIQENEAVEVSFNASLPQPMGSRADNAGLVVEQVACAVFEDGKEISNLRTTITIEANKRIGFAPRLIKGRTYKVAFWAMKEGSYNVEDMTAITRSAEVKMEGDFEAFTAVTDEMTIVGGTEVNVTLQRPFAQLNMGVTEKDWNAVASENTFNMTPATMSITLKGRDTFNALAGTPTGEEKEMTYTLSCSGTYWACDGAMYKGIAMCYVLAEAEKQTVDIEYGIYDEVGTAILEGETITNVPLQKNHKTNIVGDLMTGTVNYTISLEKAFSAEDNNKDID